MKTKHRGREPHDGVAELGCASTDTLGLPKGDVIEPMGLWPSTGLSIN